MKIRKAIRQCLQALNIPTSAISRTAGGHLRIAVGNVFIFTGSTPSDRRAVKNMKSQVRRAGGC